MDGTKLSKIPVGVILISAFYIFGATILLIFWIVNPEPVARAIAIRHGLPAATGSWILPVVAAIGLLVAFSLLSLSRWGFWLTIVYSLYFLIVNRYMSSARWVSVYCGDAIWSFLVIGYLVLARKHFFGEREVQGMQIEQ